MIKKIIAVFMVFAFTLTGVMATSIPTQDSSIYVNDYAGVIDDETKEELVSINQSSDYSTGGYVVLATFDFVDDDLYDFSYRLFNTWEIGDSSNNNGILLVMDIGNDNYSYILGTGIESILSDGDAKSIIDDYMEPDFAKQDYSSAALKTTQQFLKVIENGNFEVSDSDVSTSIQSGSSLSRLISRVVMICVILAVVILLAYSWNRSRRRRY